MKKKGLEWKTHPTGSNRAWTTWPKEEKIETKQHELNVGKLQIFIRSNVYNPSPFIEMGIKINKQGSLHVACSKLGTNMSSVLCMQRLAGVLMCP